MSHVLLSFGTCVLLWGCAYLASVALRRLCRWDVASTIPGAVWQLCGLGVVSLAAFAACSIGFTPVPRPAYLEGLARQPTLAALFVASGAIGVLHWVVTEAREQIRDLARMRWGREAALWCFIYATLGALSQWSLLPPYIVDESLYHLTFPVQHLLHGGFAVIDGHGNSSFPAFVEMLGFWPLACGCVSGARMVQLLVMALGVRAIVLLLDDVPRYLALMGVAAMVLTPVVFCLLPTAHADIPQSVYGLVAVLCFVRFQRSRSVAFLQVGAWCLGCAAACKYLALALIPFATLALLLTARAWQRQHVPLPRWPAWLGATTLVAAPVAPWLVRNVRLWGNPIFPFASALFPTRDAFLVEPQVQVLEAFMRQFGPANGDEQLFGLRALMRLPYDLFFNAHFGRLQFDGVLGPLTYAVLGASLVGLVQKEENTGAPHARLPPLVWAYGAYGLLVWLSTSWQMRFLISPYWVVCLAAPLAWARLSKRSLRLACAGVMALCLAWGAPAVMRRMPPLSPSLLAGADALHALRLQRQPETAVCDDLNRQAAPGSKAMLVWTQRIALWCLTDLMSESYDEAASFNHWLDQKSVDATLHGFADRGVTHVVIDEDYFYAMPPRGVGEAEGARLRRIFAHFGALRERRWLDIAHHEKVSLYQIDAVSPGAASLARPKVTPPWRSKTP